MLCFLLYLFSTVSRSGPEGQCMGGFCRATVTNDTTTSSRKISMVIASTTRVIKMATEKMGLAHEKTDVDSLHPETLP